MERELQKAALVAARCTKRQLKEKRIHAFDDDHSASSGTDCLVVVINIYTDTLLQCCPPLWPIGYSTRSNIGRTTV